MALLGTSLNREYNSFGHLSFRGRYFSFLLATVHLVAVTFRFFWPRFISWPLLFVSFGHRSFRGRYFSILLATVRFVAVAFKFRLICTIRIFYCIKKPPVWLGLAEKGVNYSLKRE